MQFIYFFFREVIFNLTAYKIFAKVIYVRWTKDACTRKKEKEKKGEANIWYETKEAQGKAQGKDTVTESCLDFQFIHLELESIYERKYFELWYEELLNINPIAILG